MSKQSKLLVIGAGSRGNTYSKYATGKGAKIAAIADVNPAMAEVLKSQYGNNSTNIFTNYQEALSSQQYDGVIISTPDKTHRDIGIYTLDQGNNVLLEKPMATNAQDCADILTAQEDSDKALSICHVLRYSPFFQEVKDIASSGKLGSIRSIDLKEVVGYWHFAHSYVRGNWAKEAGASPVILAKSCHDLDILTWLADSSAESVFSQGKLKHFKKENAPEGSAEKCLDCKVDCIYDAEKFYLDQDGERWPYNTISPLDKSEEGRRKALEDGPYGKCVFKSDNDVVDEQRVLIEYENGINANFSLNSGGETSERQLAIQFERGELKGDLSTGQIHTIDYTGRRNEGIKNTIETNGTGSHGGGDEILVENFLNTIQGKNQGDNLTSAQQSLESHLLCFAAEESRKKGKFGIPIDFQEFKKNLFFK